MKGNNINLKTPRLYKEAAKIIREAEKSGSSIKTLIFSAKHPNRTALYALVHQTLKYKHVIKQITDEAKLFEAEPRLDQTIAQLLIYELLYSKKQSLRGESKAVVAILNHENEIRKAFELLDSNNGICDNNPVLPRYVRVNTLKITTTEVINIFTEEGYRLINDSQDTHNDRYLEALGHLGRWEFMVDIHVPDMLAFHPKQHFFSHNLYLNGCILLQDKASCLPVLALAPPHGCVVFDACAAPGMKTTHIAALMNNEGCIYANDYNIKRHETLCKMIEMAGVTCCTLSCNDFTKVRPTDYSDVKYILLDPSCSGSGIANRVSGQQEQVKKISERLKSLSNFQSILLKHALSFPSVKKVVYSTCSVEEEENEQVVMDVLKDYKNDFKLVKAIPDWPVRGHDSFKVGPKCLRSCPQTNLTNGFFVAVFKRRKKKVVDADECEAVDVPSEMPKKERKKKKKKH